MRCRPAGRIIYSPIMGKSAEGRLFANIALPVPVDRLFTYAIPGEMEGTVGIGARVSVPFGRRKMTGYVVSLGAESPGGIDLRPISSVLDEIPLLTPQLLELASWMSRFYVQPAGIVLRTILPAGIRGKGRAEKDGGVADRFPAEPHRPPLNPGQQAVFEAVAHSAREGVPETFLLYGVTGSGKTEVYLRCIEEVLASGRSALVLVPEIALIPQSTARFQRRFGSAVAVLHSRLTGPQRAGIWKRAAAGEARVVIGPRSAVFVPIRDLGIIVIDEEQDSSFKQEEKPHYSAVEAAAFRSRNERVPLLLGSATPSLESWSGALEGRIRLFTLSERPAGGKMPRVEIVDMRGREGIISAELLGAMQETARRGEQGIILINRRGHAFYVQCGACGWIERCPNCSISLTYHSRGHRLLCHYCGHRRTPPDRCPRCGGYGIIQRGAGTQRVEMEIQNLLPGARILRMDLDTTAGKTGHLDLLEKFGRKEADFLLGTQMVAKGHHYPDVTLVGILAADEGLNFPDFRAAERTFHLLSQAAGRTGRGTRGGRVIVQAFAPGHFIYDHLPGHDFPGFAAVELALRKQLSYPPASDLILFTVSSLSAASATEGSRLVYEALEGEGLRDAQALLGPVAALVERIKGRYRFHVMARGRFPDEARKRLVDAAVRALSGMKGIDLQWDVNPVNLL